MKYLPRCIDGVCKEKVEIQPVDKCHRNESCIPGRKKCVLEGELGNVSAIVEVYPDRYVTGYGGYKFRLDYIVYVSSYETSAILLDVIKPDGAETKVMRWDLSGRIDDLEVGIYAIKGSSAVVWIRRT